MKNSMNIKQISSFLAYMIWMSIFSTAVPATLWYNGFDWMIVSGLIVIFHSIFVFIVRTWINDNDVMFFIFTALPGVGLVFLAMIGIDHDLRNMLYSRGRINWYILNIFQFLSKKRLFEVVTTEIDLYDQFKIVHYKKMDENHRFFIKVYNDEEYSLLLLINPEIEEAEL